jgi:hypothetical protein
MDPFTSVASSLDPSSFTFGERISKALANPNFLKTGGTIGFTLVHSYPIYSEEIDFRKNFPQLLKGCDALLYRIALSLGIEVQLRAVYEEKAKYLTEGTSNYDNLSFVDSDVVQFVDKFGPYSSKSAAQAVADDIEISDYYDSEDSDDSESQSVLATSELANGSALRTCSTHMESHLRDILDWAKVKVEQPVVWARKPPSKNHDAHYQKPPWSRGSTWIAMGNEVR